nr:hypothetical protein BaRGS_007413 [Batillaria attramentaria]
MEIAYAYHDKYKFILTTEPASIDGLQDSGRITPRSVCAMWVLYCRERYDAENGCRSVNYRGEFNLLELANFLRALSLPRVFHYPEDGIKSPCETDDSIGCVYIEYPVSAKEEVMKIVDSIQFDIHGTAGLVLIELKPEDGSPDSNKGPQLFVVRPGQTEKKMMDEKLYGGWALENVEYFLSEELFRSSDVPEEPAHSDDKELKEGEDGGRGVDEIDDMVLGVATEKRAKIAKIQNVPALTDKTFPSTVADSKLVVVLFYLLFDARSSVFLLHYQEAAEKLAALKGDDPSAHPLVRVNCYDWTDVCQKANITTYPQVHIYRNGQRQQYRRSLDKDVLVQTVWLLQQEQPLMLDTEMDVDKFAGGLLPEGADRMVDDVVLLKLSKSKKEMAAFEEVVKSLDTQMLFAVVGADVKAKFLPEAGVVHVRLTDVHQLMDKLTTNLDAESIKSFLLKGQFNLLPELTHKNFPALFARQLPFGILFVTGTGSYMQSVQRIIVDIIKSQTFPDLLFCKMTLDDTDTMAETILMEYAESMSLPTFAIVQHRQGKVFVLQDVDLTGAALTAWIQGVLDGSVTPTKMLKDGEWKPVGPYYDFLRMMDRDAEMKNSPESVKSYESCPSGNCDRPGETTESMQRSKEAEEMDVDIRANLLDLKHSRLYSSKDRRPHHHSPPAPAENFNVVIFSESTNSRGTKLGMLID